MRITFDITDRFARIIERCCDHQSTLDEIKEKLDTIMANQEDFDAQIARANAGIEAAVAAIAAEGQQIRDYIDANPSVDTSALEGVATRLETLSASVGGIFEPAPTEEPGV
jgi:hypothetical protein